MKYLWRSLTAPPYYGLPWLVWLYVVAANIILHHGGVFTGHLFGFDDHVRMVQVLDWVNNAQGWPAGWYDHTLMRANPPEGFTTIWSRIVDVPIAVVIVIAQHFMSQKDAAMVAATIIPMGELALLFIAVGPYFARPLVGKNNARLIALFLVFTSIVNPKYFSVSGFMVGEASHRPWYTLLDLALFGAVARLAMGSARAAPILVMGGTVALLTAVGIEGYPMIALATGLLALLAWASNRPLLASRGAAALFCGAIGGFLLLPLYQPPETFFTISYVEPSILGMILISVAGLFLKIEHEILNKIGKNKLTTAVIMLAVTAALAGALIRSFPQLLHGPLAGLSEAERLMALHDHLEAQPVHALTQTTLGAVCLLMSSVLAVAAGIFALIKSHGRRRAVTFCYLGYAAVSGVMCELFSRFYHHAQTTACVWLLWLWEYGKKRLPKNESYRLAALGLFIAIGPLWMLLLPAITADVPITSQFMLFPAYIHSLPDPCDIKPISDYINDHYDKDTLLIVPYWESSAFLFYTDVKIDFVANYPSHNKFIDSYSFWSAQDPAIAHGIATRHGVDLLALCKSPYIYRQQLPFSMQTFVAQLQGGAPIPWLKPVDIGYETNFLLYEIDKPSVKNHVLR